LERRFFLEAGFRVLELAADFDDEEAEEDPGAGAWGAPDTGALAKAAAAATASHLVVSFIVTRRFLFQDARTREFAARMRIGIILL
jgi:hypothetical protein